MQISEITDLNNTDLLKLYTDSFPIAERVDLSTFFSGVFENFKLYGLYEDNKLIGMAHVNLTDNFLHLNYFAVDKNYQNKGNGSYIISFLKNKFNKPNVVDIEEISHLADNNNDRIRRKKFYKKNGFNEGEYTFMWEGVFMTYMNTDVINPKEFMKYIQIIFPSIIDINKK